MRTAHLISDELFTKAMNEIQQGNKHIVYDSSRYLLDNGDMYFLKDEASAKLFIDIYAPSPENIVTFKASSLMDIYDHFMIEQSLKMHPTIFSQLKYTTMQEENFEYIAKQMKWAGFGDRDLDELRTKMQSGALNFQISHEATYGKDVTMSQMNFKKSEDKDMYFFNSYTMVLKADKQDDPLEQKFYINNKQDNITIKEAYNLMSGRAVEKEITPKEGEKFKAWLQLDFKETDTNGQYKVKQFHPNYGFDLDKVISAHPFKELGSPDEKQKLMESLQRGNRQMVTLEADGKVVKIFIEAAPQFKSLNYYNSDMKRVNSQERAEGTKQGAKNNVKQDDLEKKKVVKQGM